MSIEFEVSEERDRIRLVCRGAFVLEEFKQVCLHGLEEAAKRGLSRLIFDARQVTCNPTTTQRYELATYAADLYIRRQPASPMRIVLLLDPAVIDPEGFGQTVARNRGVPVLVTAVESEAEAFLRGDTSE
ncbi:MAG TPA: hypothetical protein PLX06_01095 [Fimbriimonadaceae bacterium]|nr:hypothetical protein [Fimbriimonadaceae bacterium]